MRRAAAGAPRTLTPATTGAVPSPPRQSAQQLRARARPGCAAAPPAGRRSWSPPWSLFAVLTAVTAVQRHHEYRTYRNDMGNMVQVVDNTAHGRILQMTGNDGRQINRLAAHVDPILAAVRAPVAGLARPGHAARSLQAALVGARRVAGLPARAAACSATRRPRPSAPPRPSSTPRCSSPRSTSSTRSRSSSPCCCSPSSSSRRTGAGSRLPFLVLAALCKEEIPLVIALMGLYFALRKRTLWPLLITVVAGAVLPGRRGRRHPALQRRRRQPVPGPLLRTARRACAASPRAC